MCKTLYFSCEESHSWRLCAHRHKATPPLTSFLVLGSEGGTEAEMELCGSSNWCCFRGCRVLKQKLGKDVQLVLMISGILPQGARRERYNSLPVSAAITSYCLPSSLHILSTSRFPLKLEKVLLPLAFCWAYWIRYESLEGCYRIDHLCSLHMRLIYPPSGAYAVCQGPGRYISVLLAVDQKKRQIPSLLLLADWQAYAAI